VRRRRHRSYGLSDHRPIYKGRLPRTLPGIPAPAALTGSWGARSRTGGPTHPVPRGAGGVRRSGPGLGTATAYVAVGTLVSRVTGLLRILVAIYAL